MPPVASMAERVRTFAGEDASGRDCGNRLPVTLTSSSVYTRARPRAVCALSSAVTSEIISAARPARGERRTESVRRRMVLREGNNACRLSTKKPLFSWEDRGFWARGESHPSTASATFPRRRFMDTVPAGLLACDGLRVLPSQPSGQWQIHPLSPTVAGQLPIKRNSLHRHRFCEGTTQIYGWRGGMSSIFARC